MDKGKPRITAQTLKVMGALMSSQDMDMSGADIARATKLQSGTLYPILLRLERAKWLESHWEVGNPSDLGRPRRRYYRLTGLGARSARSTFRDIASSIGVGGLAWQ